MQKFKLFYKKLAQIIKLNPKHRSQIVFMISMALYHSPEFMIIKNKQQNTSPMFLLQLINQINIVLLQGVFCVVSLVTIGLALAKFIIQRVQCQLLCIYEKLVFPLQIYASFLIVINGQNIQYLNSTNSLVRIIYWFSTGAVLFLILVKELLFNQQNNSNLNCNRIVKQEYFFILIKLAITGFLVILFPQQKFLLILCIVLINVTNNIVVSKNVIFQHPVIEYLYLLSQFYIWIPLLGVIYSELNQKTSLNAVYNYMGFFLYVFIGIIKPSIFVGLLEKKYVTCFRKLSRKHHNSLKNQSKDFMASLSATIYLFFQENNSTSKIEFSKNFNKQVYDFIKNRATRKQIRINQNPNPSDYNLQQINSNTSKIQQNRKAKINHQSQIYNTQQAFLINHLSLFFCNSKQEQHSYKIKEKLFDLLWKIVQSSLAFQKSNNNQLKYFICYHFPDLTNQMKYRKFYCLYSNQQIKMGIIDKIQAQICHKYLLQKIGRHENFIQKQQQNQQQQNSLCRNLQQIGDSKNCKENQNNLTQQIFNTAQKSTSQLDYRKQNCLKHTKNYFNPIYNDMVRQHQIYLSVLGKLEGFQENQKYYLKIFENLKQNKQNIRKYYQTRKMFRSDISEQIVKYSELQNKRNQVKLILNYIKENFLNKNTRISVINLSKQIQQLFQNYQNKFSLLQNNPKEQSSLYGGRSSEINKGMNNFTCVISGVVSLGNIQISSSKFKQLVLEHKLGEIFEGSKSHSPKHNINNYLVPIWRHQHFELMKDSKIFLKPTHHIKQKYFMISYKQTTVFQIKFRMFYFTKLSTDFMMVLEMDYQVLDSLQIMSDGGNSLFVHKSNKKDLDASYCLISSTFGQKKASAQITVKQMQKTSGTKKRHQPSQQRLQTQLIQVFDKRYSIEYSRECQLKSEQTLHGTSSVRQYKRSNSQSHKSNNNQKTQTTTSNDQIKFIKYKQNFSFQSFTFDLIRLSVFLSIIVFPLLLRNFFMDQLNNQIMQLDLAQKKMVLMNRFITYDCQTGVTVRILESVVKKRINFSHNSSTALKDPRQTFLMDLYHNIQDQKQQTSRRFIQMASIQRRNAFTQNLLNSHWIEGSQISFLSKQLLRYLKLTLTLKIFLKQNDWVQPKKEGSQFNISNFPQSLKTDDKIRLRKYNEQTIKMMDYYFKKGGLVDHIKQIQEWQRESVREQRFNQFQIINSIFISFFLLLVYLLRRMKLEYLTVYNHAIRTSRGFQLSFKRQTQYLGSLIQVMNSHHQGYILSKIVNQATAIVEHQKSAMIINKKSAMIIHNKSTSLGYKPASRLNLTDRRHDLIGGQPVYQAKKGDKWQVQDAAYQESTLNSTKYLLQSVLFPTLRMIALTLCIVVTYSVNYKNIQILTLFNQGLQSITLTNSLYAQALAINLQILNYDSLGIQIQVRKQNQFQQILAKINSLSQQKSTFKLFPLNVQISNQLLYSNSAYDFLRIQIPEFIADDGKSLQETISKLNKNLRNIFSKLAKNKNQTASIINTQSRLLQSFNYLNKLLYIYGQASQKGYQMVKQRILSYEYQIIFISITIFLLIQFVMGTKHFKDIQETFVSQFLNLGPYRDLSKEQGFQYFINQSKQNYHTYTQEI